MRGAPHLRDLPAATGMRCRCRVCRSPWWSTALGLLRRPACPFCGSSCVKVRQDPPTAAEAPPEHHPLRPTFPTSTAEHLKAKGGRVRWFAANLPEWARYHDALPAVLDVVEGEPITARTQRQVLDALRSIDAMEARP